MPHAAWIQSDALDTDTVARFASSLALYFQRNRVHNSASESALVIEAARIFQEVHFSLDPDYWDARDYPEAIAWFASDVIEAFESDPAWINTKYVGNRESLRDLLFRWPDTVE